MERFLLFNNQGDFVGYTDEFSNTQLRPSPSHAISQPSNVLPVYQDRTRLRRLRLLRYVSGFFCGFAVFECIASLPGTACSAAFASPLISQTHVVPRQSSDVGSVVQQGLQHSPRIQLPPPPAPMSQASYNPPHSSNVGSAIQQVWFIFVV
uniref:Uncharacterized protein n=1 Tax=Ditylenchus dipsaci TaxID=166011 RepID=A0A915DI11_9BILA